MKYWMTLLVLISPMLHACTKDMHDAVPLPPPQEEETTPVVQPLVPVKLSEAESLLPLKSNDFGIEVYRRVAEGNQNKTVFVSPLSLSLALSMCSLGADGETERQMRTVLGFGDVSQAVLCTYYQKMQDALRTIDTTTVVEIANAIWTDKKIQLKAPFVSSADSYFKSTAESVDFTLSATRERINAWCAEKTHGKITSILDGDNPSLVMLLANALYFNGKWKEKFPDAVNDKFTDITGKEKTVEMMHQQKSFRYAATEMGQVLELPYGNGAYAMDIVLPAKTEDFSASLKLLTGESWQKAMEKLSYRTVDVKLPKFKATFEVQLNSILSQMGMPLAFTGSADFSRMSDSPLCIDFVKQKTFVDVNEKGTEAAAVTAIGMRLTSVGPPEIINFHADHPFIFAIRECTTGTILFIGGKLD